jgi:hypothetical protein
MFPTEPKSLTLQQLDEAASSFKDDLTRECERRVRRGDSVGALTAIHAKEYIDKFVFTLKQRAGSNLDRAAWPARARPIRIFKPPKKRGA